MNIGIVGGALPDSFSRTDEASATESGSSNAIRRPRLTAGASCSPISRSRSFVISRPSSTRR
jgi:hypothetical protein